ncbi:MAG: 1-acyl-sn-glycerol-3-phosphate acyltransferase [Candidatus Binatia bacterium]
MLDNVSETMTQPALKPESAPPPAPPRAAAPRVNLLVDWICRRLFAPIRLAPSTVEHLRTVAARGSVVYVMRQRSVLDFLLVSYVLKREGLPAPEFVNDVSLVWLRPLADMARGVWRRLRRTRLFSRELRAHENRDRCQRLVAQGRPVLLFLRARAPAMPRRAHRRGGLSNVRPGSDYLREIVHHLWTGGHEVSLVPVAVLRGRGGMRRKESRLATLVYSVQEVPGEIRRLVSLLWNRHETSLSIGGEVAVREFTRQYQREGEERIVRRLTRALQIFLYREERVVWGPQLLPKRQVRQRALQDDEVREAVRRLAANGKQPESQLWRQAERYFDEMAANFHGIYFSFLEFVFNRIWPRLFQGFEYSGLERVLECMKQHPVVLVPCHRSHFDYVILSYLFHLNYMSPPHIAAGINLSFWPLGPLFRGAGAYFIRRSFDDNVLYKAVFRSYLKFLIREGYTQEFFIEGGRSRTGKILTPKLGMLSAVVDAYAQGVRRDLFLVPVSIHYGRVVEEEAYQRELGGGEKEKESLASLVRARRVLSRRHGTVYINFAEPISLSAALGDRKAAFRDQQDAAAEERKRRFVQKLGFRLLREVNDASVAGATSVSATVLLSLPHRACRLDDFVARAQALTRYLRARGVRFTASLERNEAGGFRENLGFLESGGLIQRLASEARSVIYVPGEKRLALDFYKNNTIHFFLLPALLLDAFGRGLRGADAQADVSWWLDFLRWEFPLPERDDIAAELERVRAYLCVEGALTADDTIDPLHPFVVTVRAILDNFRETYWVAAQVLRELPEAGLTQKALVERMQKRYRTGLLLGEVHKPEGNSSVTLGNAISRYAELEWIQVRKGKGKERDILRGERFDGLEATAARVGAGVIGV